jgi:hypothetical protein
MSGCALRRWGSPGGAGASQRPPDTAAAREIEAKLAAIRTEREKQDAALWGAPAAAAMTAGTPCSNPTPTTAHSSARIHSIY